VHVLRPGVIQLNNEPLQTQELERRLEAIFRTRVYRYVFVTGGPGLQFRDVADIIDGVCFDENLPRDYRRHPPR